MLLAILLATTFDIRAAQRFADLALACWEPFDPLLHAAPIHTRLPHSSPRPHRRG